MCYIILFRGNIKRVYMFIYLRYNYINRYIYSSKSYTYDNHEVLYLFLFQLIFYMYLLYIYCLSILFKFLLFMFTFYRIL